MAKTYRIRLIGTKLDASSCPPAIASDLWPTFDGWPCQLSESECLVTVPDSAPPPADLGPLVKVEAL